MKQRNNYKPIRILITIIAVVLAAAPHGFANPSNPDRSFSGIEYTAASSVGGGALASALQADGKIVLAGYGTCANFVCFALIRYTEDGALDPTFSGNGKVVTTFGSLNSYISAIEIQSDGKIVAGGFTRVLDYGATKFALARYNADGSLDSSFGKDGRVETNLGNGWSEIKALAIAPDGKIVVAGSTDGLMVGVRYNTDGTIDNTFDGDGIFIFSKSPVANAVLIQPDGKIVFAGYRKGVYPSTEYLTARLNENGSFDTSFNGSGIAPAPTSIEGRYAAHALFLQPDGKLLVSGYWYGYYAGIYRYNPDGTLDNSFGANGLSVVYSNPDYHKIAVQPDGKIILAAGSYQLLSGRRGFLVIRLNPNGTVDQQINASGMIITALGKREDNATGVVIQPNGRVVATGYSGSPSGMRFAAVGYTPEGRIDFTFGSRGKVLSTIGYTTSPDAYSSVSVGDDKR